MISVRLFLGACLAVWLFGLQPAHAQTCDCDVSVSRVTSYNALLSLDAQEQPEAQQTHLPFGAPTPATSATNTCARYSAPPVRTSASPSAKLATTIMITGALNARVASRQLRQPVKIITSTPTEALMAMGKMPRAARRTIAAIMLNASGAFTV